MAYDGYLSFGGTELINEERTRKYVEHQLPQMALRPNPNVSRTLHVALGDAPYESPLVDDAEWANPSDPATHDFFGLYPLSIQGIGDSTQQASVTESLRAGGSVGDARDATREVRVHGLLLGANELGVEAGLSWLRAALRADTCSSHGGACGASDLRYFLDNPDVCFEKFDHVAGQPPEVESYSVGALSPASSPIIVNIDQALEAPAYVTWHFELIDGVVITWGRMARKSSKVLQESAPTVLQRTNFVNNPSFTSNTDFWTADDSTLSRELAGGVDGGAYGHLQEDDAPVVRFNWAPDPGFVNADPRTSGWRLLNGTTGSTGAGGPTDRMATFTQPSPGLGVGAEVSLLGSGGEPTLSTLSFWLGAHSEAVTATVVNNLGVVVEEAEFPPAAAGRVDLQAAVESNFILRLESPASSIAVADLLVERGTTAGVFFTGDSDSGTNLATNPSFESVTPGSTVVRTNLHKYPSLEGGTPAGYMARGAGSTAIAVTTDEAHSGTRSLRVTTSGTVAHEGAFSNGTGIASSGIAGAHAVSAWILASTGAQLYLQSTEEPPGGGSGTLLGRTDFTGTGEWQRVSVSGVTATATNVTTLVLGTAVPQALVVYLDDVLIEASSSVGDYFDGSTPDALGWDYGWTGTAHGSTSTAKAGVVTTRTNLYINPGAAAAGGNTEGFRVYWGSGAGYSQDWVAAAWSESGSSRRMVLTVDATGGTSVTQVLNLDNYITGVGLWTIVQHVKYDAGLTAQTTTSFTESGAGNVLVSSRLDDLGGGVYRRVATINIIDFATFAAQSNPRIDFSFGGRAVGLGIEMSMVDIYSGAYDPSRGWLWGSKSAAGDFTYAWAGTANASASVQRAPGLAGVATNFAERAFRIQSSEWANSGTKSVRIIPRQSSSYVELPLTGLGVEAGKTYTLLGVVRLPAALTGPLHTRALQFWVTAGGDPEVVFSQQATNAPGEYLVRGTFVAGSSSHSVRLMNGATEGGGDVWWDDLTIVEGVYDGPPFSDQIEHSYVGQSLLSASRERLGPVTPNTLTAVMPDTRYGDLMASFSLKSDTVASLTAELVSLDDETVLASREIVTSFGWTRYSLPTHYGRNVKLVLEGAGSYDIDQVLVEASNASWDYFDGSTPAAEGYVTQWLGFPDASYSRTSWTGAALTQWGDSDWRPFITARQGTLPDVVVDMGHYDRITVQSQLDPYERNYHDVRPVQGPTVLRRLALDIGAAIEVEFLLVAETPFAFTNGREIDVTGLATELYSDPDLPPDPEDELVDPDCGPIPTAPRPPVIPELCVDEISDWRRYYLDIPEEDVALWASTVPTISLTTKAQEVRQVRVRFHPNPFGYPKEIVDPLSYCGEFILSYLPAQTVLTVNGMNERAYAAVAGSTFVPADHLLYGTGGSPMEWPALSCGIPYVMTIDVPPTDDLDNLEVELVVNRRE